MVTEEQKRAMLEMLDKKLNQQLTASLNTCAHCGMCSDSCHFYKATGDPKEVPAHKADRLRSIYKRYYDPVGRLAPGWAGARDLDDRAVEEMTDSLFGSCTMCRRCTMNCPMGIDMGLIARTGRSMLDAAGLVPRGLQEGVDMTLNTGNNMGLNREEIVETVEWLEEELQAEMDDPTARIPLDKEGARVLFIPIPFEIKDFPMTIQAIAKIMHAAGEDWTMSTEAIDSTNLGLFSGNDKAAATHAGRLADTAEKLGVEWVLSSECGHGYRQFRWEAENWLGRKFKFRVASLIEYLYFLLKEDLVKVDPAKARGLYTYHDPCNLARNGGVIEEPRYILRKCLGDKFVEMTPHGIENYCCSGGGGALTMAEYAPRRIEAGRVKAEQIRATGADTVVTGCHNCLVQLRDLNKIYKLNVRILMPSEVVAETLVLEK